MQKLNWEQRDHDAVTIRLGMHVKHRFRYVVCGVGMFYSIK